MSEPVSQKKERERSSPSSIQLLARLTGDSKVAAGAMVNG